MTLDEARVVWLTTLGSGWVDMFEVFDFKGDFVWQAYSILLRADVLRFDPATDRAKII